LRRPFAPGAIGFRAMTKVPFNGEPYTGAQVAAYLGVQSVIQRLNAVVPGRWRQQFQSVPAEFVPAGSRRVYLACRLIVTLPVEDGGSEVDAVYEDLGEMDSGSFAGVKALYSDARERAEVADQPAQPAAEQAGETPAANGNGRGEVVTVDISDLGPAAA
jgi:hypothetical protein